MEGSAKGKGKSTTLHDTEVLLHCYSMYKLWYHLPNAILNCIMGYVISQARAEHLRKHLGLSKLSKDNLGLLAEVVGGRVLVKYLSKDNLIMLLTERLARVEAMVRQHYFDKGKDDSGKGDKAKIQDKGSDDSDIDSDEEIIDNIKSFIEKRALTISEWGFTEDNPENPYITMRFKGKGYDNSDTDSGKDDKAKIQDKGSDDSDIGMGKDDSGKDGSGKDDSGKDDSGEDEVTWFKEPHHDMQPFVKTISFGTILVSAHHLDQINEVAKRRRRVIEAMSHGDVELMAGQEQIMTFTSKQLEDDRTLKHYNIQNESTLTMTMRVRGGGKRPRVKPNPFEEEMLQFVKHENLDDFEAAFHTCLNIANTESLDPLTMLGQCDIQGPNTMKTHLSTGKAHHLNKVE